MRLVRVLLLVVVLGVGLGLLLGAVTSSSDERSSQLGPFVTGGGDNVQIVAPRAAP